MYTPTQDVAYAPVSYETISITKCEKRENVKKKSGWPQTLVGFTSETLPSIHVLDLTLRPPTPGTGCPINLAG